MKRITLSIDEKTHKLASARAAELGGSVSALVGGCLRRLTESSEGIGNLTSMGGGL